jgi:2-dehydropantoate 2-reductase
MRIAVVGAGGVGGYFGGRLAQGGADVVFIVRGATLAALRTRGLRIESIKGDFALDDVQATDDARSVGVVDAVLLTVKAWQIPDALASIKPMLKNDTAIVPLENGMEAPQQIAQIVGLRHAVGGLCGIVSFAVAPGHIRHIGAEPFVMFGELDNHRSERVEKLHAAFEDAGVRVEVPVDIHRSMWSKFLFIAPMSAVGAATRVPIGVWRSIPETRELVTQAIHEVLAVAAARGIDLGNDAVARTLDRYDGLPPESTSSLQRDVMEGKPSELDAQLGAVVRMGTEKSVPTPVFDTLYRALLPQERQVRGDPGDPATMTR